MLITRAPAPVLLVWPANLTTWDAGTRAVAFANENGATVTVGDGDRVTVGGSGDSFEESGTTAEEWLQRTLWIKPPDTGCPMDGRWWVGALAR